jgi:hypothetical protein
MALINRMLILLSLSLYLSFGIRSYRNRRHPIVPLEIEYKQGEIAVQKVASNVPWVKPLAVGSLAILSLAVVVFTAFPPVSSGTELKGLSTWVFGLPLGTLIFCLALGCILKLLSLVFDEIAIALKSARFELVFLAVLGASLLFAYAYISAMKKKQAEPEAEFDLLSIIGPSNASPFGSLTLGLQNVIKITIIADYIYICVEWMRKNHLTICGFALLVTSFYIFYVLP